VRKSNFGAVLGMASLGLMGIGGATAVNTGDATARTAEASSTQQTAQKQAPQKSQQQQKAGQAWRWAPGSSRHIGAHDGLHRGSGWWNKRRWKLRKWSGKAKRR